MRVETASAAVSDIVKLMVEQEQARGHFKMRDIRRTCETTLAAMGVSQEVRVQLQSHGLGGVQNRHYGRHKYMDEKRHALDAWMRHLAKLSKQQKRVSKLFIDKQESFDQREMKAG